MLLGIVIGAAGFGNALGIGLGSLLKTLNPRSPWWSRCSPTR